MPLVTEIPAGTRGFDCNVAVGADSARRMAAAGYRFAVRYVRRATARANDLSAVEVGLLHQAGLAVMAVQHVESDSPPGWTPSLAKGREYGVNAVDGARRANLPGGVCVWLDLEMVAPSTPAETILSYATEWYTQVVNAGYTPGLYVGYGCGLTARQLYEKLPFEHYWASYNLNGDQYPAVRGVEMKQGSGSPPAGVPFAIDTDLVTGDALGGFPIAYAPDEWPALRLGGGATGGGGGSSLGSGPDGYDTLLTDPNANTGLFAFVGLATVAALGYALWRKLYG